MRNVLKKVLCLLWLLFFLQAALEVNVCGIEHTFNDEYDTYMISTTVSVPHPALLTVNFDFCIAFAGIFSWNMFENISEINIYNPFSEKRGTFRPPPLNILHSVWII